MVIQEQCVLKCSQSKGIISVQFTLLRSVTMAYRGHKQEKFGANLAR
jgi:hypothetical protein